MRLLIIEDNEKLCNSMKAGLEKENFSIDAVYFGEAGEELAYVNKYDVILLDLNLPDKDGIEILKYLRSENIDTPVIIITARDQVNERTLGLNLGADDYLTKPFQLSELYARVRAVIRRYHGRTNPVIKIDKLQINPSMRTVYWNNNQINLVMKEFAILEYVAMCHPNVVSIEEIGEHVYDESYNPFSSVLRVHIMRLRNKLQQATGYDLLITSRGKGYSLCIFQNK